MNERSRMANFLEWVLAQVLPRSTADLLRRDLDEGFQQRRQEQTVAAARRWHRRQLLLSLHPARIAELRRAAPGNALPYAGERPDRLRTRLARAIGYLVLDLRYSLRLLVKNPRMSLLTVMVLGGGLGVSIFTYSLLNAMMLKPLPLPGGESIVRVMSVEASGRSNLLDAVDYGAVRRRVEGIELLGAYETEELLMRGGDQPRPVRATVTSPNLFAVAAIPPLLGRTLAPDDAVPGAAPVVVLGYAMWQGNFGGDSEIIETDIEFNGIPTRVVGVMPEGFGFPVRGELWLPLANDAYVDVERGRRWPSVYGRIAPGVTRDTVNSELATIMQAWRLEEPLTVEEADAAPSARVLSFPVAQMGDEANFVFVLLNMVSSFILLLACINVANLMVSRAAERSRETTVRVALGAPRGRLLMQMMGEGVIISVAGGAIALLIAGQGLRFFSDFIHNMAPGGTPFWYRWGLDADTLRATVGFVLMTILVVGGLPAWRASRADSDALLREGTHGAVGGAAGRTARSLVVLQVALIAILMFLGGISAYLAQEAGSVSLGLDTTGAMTSTVRLPADSYSDPEQQLAFFDRVQRDLGNDPAISTAVLRATLPPGTYAVEGTDYERPEEQPRARATAVHGPLPSLGVALHAGRVFGATDVAGAERVALISESLAATAWPGRSAIGQHLKLGDHDAGGDWLIVVGVVSGVLVGNPFSSESHFDNIWVPMAQVPARAVQVTFTHTGDPRAAVTALYDTFDAIDPATRPEQVRDLDEMFRTMSVTANLMTQVLIGCFAFALVLAVSGIYGLTARSVTLRTQEIGIRRALGATDACVVRLFFRNGGRQLAVGLGLAALVGGLTSFAASQLIYIAPHVYLLAGFGVPICIALVVLLAIYVPTRQAIRLEPSVALWHE